VDNKFSFSYAENRRDKQNFNLADALQDEGGFFKSSGSDQANYLK